MKKFYSLALLLPLLLSACGDKQDAQLSQPQADQVKEIVQKTLMENPKIILDALEAYQKQTRAEAAENTKKAIATRANDIYNNPSSPVMGKPDGNITVVEFFDYNCGYCKAVFHPIRDAVLQDGNIKFVFKEYPILGESSVYASKAALAANKQGKYVEFHTALMDFRGNKDEAAITQIATTLGLNVAQLKADMNSPEIQQIIDADRNLGMALGVNGTPGFIIGDKLYPGALDADSFKKTVQDFRQAKAQPTAPAGNAAPTAPAAQ